MKIGIAGLGVMGMPITKNLIKHGFNIVAYARRSEVAAEIRPLGAEVVNDIRYVAKSSDVFITLLPSGAALTEVLFDPNTGAIEGLKEGSLVIDMGTTSPALTREICEKLSERGVDFLDSPVSGGAERARDGTLTVMVGGKYDIYQKAYCIFKAIGSKVYYTGESSTAQMIKLVNNMIACINIVAVCEGLALGERTGLDLEQLVEIINCSSGQSYASGIKAKNYILPRQFKNGAKATIFNKDITLAISIAEKLGLRLALAEDTKKYLERLVELGLGELDASASILLLEDRPVAPDLADRTCIRANCSSGDVKGGM